MRRALLLVVPISLMLSACRSPGLGRAQAHWLRVRTPHFVVHTDLDERTARERAELLERLLAAYLQLGWDHHGELPLQLNVVLFAERSELDELMCKSDQIGAFGRALFEPWAVLSGDVRTETLSVLRHELSHYLAFMAMQYQPPWFAEGIASYFETAYFDDEQGFVVGRAPPSLVQLLQRGALLPAEQLLDDSLEQPTAEFYASAWLLVHYLMSEREAAFIRYQQGLQKGKGHRVAWSEAFPDLTVARVDRLLSEYLRGGELASYSRKVALPATASSFERLTRADEYALRGLLYGLQARCGERHEQRRRESLTQALKLAPHQLEASVLETLASAVGEAGRLERARALSVEHPSSWLAWLTLATVAQQEQALPVAAAAVTRALELAPRKPQAHMLSALIAAEAGQLGAALRSSERALRILPNDGNLLLQRAQVLSAAGECELLERTLATLSALAHGGPSDEQRAFTKQLVVLCSSGATAD